MTGSSSCPECGTILRIRDRTFVGRRVSCPACKASLRIDSTDGKGNYVVHRATERIPQKSTALESPNSVEPKAPTVALKTSISRWFYSPLTAAWLLAIAVSALIAVVTLSPKFRFARSKPAPVRVDPKLSEETRPTAEEPPPTMEATPPTATPATEPSPASPREELVAISALEPANVDGPLPILPPPVKHEEKPEPVPEPPKPPVKKDIPAKFAQEFTRYTQPKIRRRDLLEALQEQLDADIKYDEQELGTESLDDTVSFDLPKTTLGEVIKKVAEGAGWDIVTEDRGIRLTRKNF